MSEDEPSGAEEAELRAAIEKVLSSPSPKRLVIAGPGTGKTALFKRILEAAAGDPQQRVVLTFINNLRDDLERDLVGLAEVFTLHAFCLGLLYREAGLRGSLPPDFRCRPGLRSLIAEDWEFIEGSEAPQFVNEMRNLAKDSHIAFYLARGEYYHAVDFDDAVYRAYQGMSAGRAAPDTYELVLVDEYQDFNTLEAGLIKVLGERNAIIIAGDDDQALYSQLRGASWDHIRLLCSTGEYEVFELPFCMRCPKVVVDAVNDVLTRARELHKLDGRIDKQYKHFSPLKGADSIKYPIIAYVETSVQRENANYMGRYVAQAVAEIPTDESETAIRDGYPASLVIVAKPYRDQIIGYLEAAGYVVDTRREAESKLDRGLGLSMLREDVNSNLGWRIMIGVDKPAFMADVIRATAEGTQLLMDLLPSQYRDDVLAEVAAWEPPGEVLEGSRATAAAAESPHVRVTSFEGAKGLSAQHVFIVGLHDGELPRDPTAIKDLEICKFVVGLTRTRKKCTLITTRNFAGSRKSASCFISWIDAARVKVIEVNAAYWKKA